jgi:acetoin utilization protein AcuC
VLGWLPNGVIEAAAADLDQLARGHSRAYLEALIEADRGGTVSIESRQRFNLGNFENPLFPGLFRRAATACGGSMLAAELVASGGTAYCPMGGTHHGRRDRASGFCYLNDPVMGLIRLLDRGFTRVLYVDIDAHHGDGVEAFFAGDPRILMLSVHETGRWPYTGGVHERAGGSARNLPVPAGLNDTEMAAVVDRAIVPLGRAFAPEAVMVLCGADALAEDPLSRLALSNGALWRAVSALVSLAPRAVVLGGGGYNPWATVRCWTGVWAALNGYPIPDRLPMPVEAILRGLDWDMDDGPQDRPEHWFTTLGDRPNPGSVRPEIDRVISAALAV